MSEIISKIGSFFTTFSLIIAYIFGFGTVSVSDGYEMTGQEKLTMLDALYMGQGICTDGEYYYSSGSITAINFTGIAKWNKDMKRIKSRSGAVPKELYEMCGSNHIGGIDCANGLIYAPVEDDDYKRNFIITFDCETLEYAGDCYEMTCDKLGDGIPWCAVDGENGYLYTSQFDNVNEILRYNLADMTFDKAIPIDTTVNRIQGGSVYNGSIYLSYDVSHSVDEEVIKIDLDNGHVETEMVRYLCNYDNEAEDIVVYPFDDGSLIHIIDYDKLVGVNFRHYAPAK